MPRPDLAKRIPAADIESVFPPNESYAYFRDALEHPFDASGAFRWVTASWCADAALLSYFNEARILAECKGAGFQHSQFIEQQNTQCFIAQTATFALVAFRGTTVLKIGTNFSANDMRGSANAAFDALRDVLTDSSILPDFSGQRGQVHSGFKMALDAVWPQLQSFQAQHPGLPIWFTGHSLGAALAVLAADRYRKSGGTVAGVYTFGSPVIGDEDFTHHYTLEDRTFRFVNNNDWLPKLDIGYQHIGQLHYIFSTGAIDNDTDVLSRVADQFKGTASHTIDLLKHWSKFRFDLIASDSFRDHAPIYYATHVWNYYVNQL